jgi:hypothetical protein
MRSISVTPFQASRDRKDSTDAAKKRVGKAKNSPNGMDHPNRVYKNKVSTHSIHEPKSNAIIRVHQSSFVGQEPSFSLEP